MITALINYFVRIGDATSQWANSVFFLSKNPNESISGRCWRLRNHWFWGNFRKLIDFLFRPFEKYHCEKAYYADVRRAKELLALVDNSVHSV